MDTKPTRRRLTADQVRAACTPGAMTAHAVRAAEDIIRAAYDGRDIADEVAALKRIGRKRRTRSNKPRVMWAERAELIPFGPGGISGRELMEKCGVVYGQRGYVIKTLKRLYRIEHGPHGYFRPSDV